MGSRRRQRAVGTAMLLGVLVVAPMTSALADPPTSRGIDRVCPAPTRAETDPEPRLPDAGVTHAAAIACAADYGLVSGFGDGTYRPDEPVTRGQMASFVAASLSAATGLRLAEATAETFTDIDGNVHAQAITAIAEVGIVGGRPDGTFGPDETLTRGQFTRAVANAISYADVFAIDGPLPPPHDDIAFTDVDGTTFATTIGSLAGAGIALGTADGAFRPQAAVTRGQLATFLMRTADYLDRYQRWRPTARSQALLVAELVAVGGAEDPDTDPLRATVTLDLHAFEGTLGYIIDLSGTPGPYVGATIHRGDPTGSGPLVLTLADAEALAGDTAGRVTGVIREADSNLRFADLLEHPGEAYAQIATTDAPDGVVRGRLRVPGG